MKRVDGQGLQYLFELKNDDAFSESGTTAVPIKFVKFHKIQYFGFFC